MALTEDDRRPDARVGPLRVLLAALGVGLVWMCLEFALALGFGRAFLLGQVVDRIGWLLPWQLALFGAIGVGVGVIARLRALSWPAAVWWILACGNGAFLGESLVEGLLRKRGLGTMLLGLSGLAFLLLGLAFLSLGIARRLPNRAARAFSWAVWSGFSVLFLVWMQHSSSAIRIWQPDVSVLWSYLEPSHLLAAAGASLLVGLVALAVPIGRAAPVCVAGLFVAVGSSAWAEPAQSPPSRRPDVLLLVIDTLRFDHVGVNVGVEGLTPEIDAVARESVLFTRGFSPGNYTKLAMPGIMTSLPYRVVKTPLPEEITTLAEHLEAAGYANYGISANPYVTRAFGYAQGFGDFSDPASMNEFLVEALLEAVGMVIPSTSYRLGLVSSALYYAPVASIRRRALEIFESSPSPTFVYLQTMDPHGPYLPPHRYLPDDFTYDDFESYFAFDALKGRGVLGTPDYAPRLRNLRQRYRGEVRFTDEEVGRMVAGLREMGRWDEMLVILLSDHGEAFGEHDWAGHSGPNVSRTLVQVPFLVKPPRSWEIAPRVDPSLVSTFDVLPTVLSLLGLPAADHAFGRDLSPLLRGEAAVADRTVVSFGFGTDVEVYTAVRGPWKLDVVLDRRSGESIESRLYDLRSDPDELHDVADAHPGETRDLSRAVQLWREREDSMVLSDEAEIADPAVREQLRSLGYIE